MIPGNEINKQLKKTKTWEEVSHAIEENGLSIVCRSILKEIPASGAIASVIDDSLVAFVDRQVDENRKKLIRCLKEASPEITLTSVSGEIFLMDYINLYDACMRLRSNEKIQFMANLFVSAHCGDVRCDLDEYDEMIEKLNRLSFREICILRLLHAEGKTNPRFYENVKDELGLEREITNNILSSMTQSGFCKEKVGTYLDYTGGSFYTTELYERFLDLIGVSEKNSNYAGEKDSTHVNEKK